MLNNLENSHLGDGNSNSSQVDYFPTTVYPKKVFDSSYTTTIC